jgi:hypothetical protein
MPERRGTGPDGRWLTLGTDLIKFLTLGRQ